MSVDARARRRTGGHQRAQALVEYTLLVPVFLLILLGMLEFGLVFSHDLTLEYATREGARTGAALANGGTTNCPSGTYDPDPDIIAAVERVLTSPGSPVANNIASVTQIQIYKATAAGAPVSAATTNTWVPGTGPIVDGVPMKFKLSGTQNWTACQRNNATVPPDSIGVNLKYTYTMVTPLAAIVGFFGPPGPATLPMHDQTVMSLNPTN